MLPKARVNVILGASGTGKSRLLTALTRDLDRLVVVDTMLEHAALARPAALDDLYDQVRGGGPFRSSVWPEDLEDLEWVERLVASVPNTSLAIDEYSFWRPTALHIPGPGLLALVRCGRKLHQSVYLTTQSPGAICKQLTGGAALWILQLFEPREVEYVQARTGDLVNPRELAPVETGPAGVSVARIALYLEGERQDFALDCAGLEIRSL